MNTTIPTSSSSSSMNLKQKSNKIVYVAAVALVVITIILLVYVGRTKQKHDAVDSSVSSAYDETDHFFQKRWNLSDKKTVKSELSVIKNYFIFDETLLGFVQLNDVLPWNVNFTVVVDAAEAQKHAWGSEFRAFVSSTVTFFGGSSGGNQVVTFVEAPDWNGDDEGSVFRVGELEFQRADIFPLRDGELTGDITIPIKYPNNPNAVLDVLFKEYDWHVYCKSMEEIKRLNRKISETHMSTWTQIKYPVRASELFGEVYIINLDKRTDRWQSTQEKLAAIGIKNGKRWTAIDADHDAVKDIYVEIFGKNSPDHLSRRELACYLSHYSLWVYLQQTGVQYALILEDDISMPGVSGLDDFQKVLDESLGFNILFFGHCLTLGKDLKRRFYDHLTEKGAGLCLHAYAVSKLGIQNLIEYANSADVQRQADIVTRNFCTKKLCYLSHSLKDSDDKKYFAEGLIVQDREKLGSDIGKAD